MGGVNPARQKMINMMYLVLTALLALNVSKQVLRAFDLVNFSMETSKASFDDKNKETIDRLDAAVAKNPKAKFPRDKAREIDALAKDMNAIIQKMKDDLIAAGGKYEIEDKASGLKAGLDKQDDLEIGTHYFGQAPEIQGGLGNGDKLRSKLDKFKTDLIAAMKAPSPEGCKGIDPDFKVVLDTEAKKKVSDKEGKVIEEEWTKFFFLEYPLVSNIVMLSNFQQQVNTIKAEALKRCAAAIGQDDFKFDNLVAIIKADKPIVLEGDEYKAEVVLGAYDSKASPNMTINGANVTVKDGKGEYKVRASGQGNKKLTAIITVSNNGETKSYKTETEYQVFKGSATISADKMNVVYIGLDNPISVSVPGYPPSAIQASATGGQLIPDGSKGAGHYIFKPSNSLDVKEAVISVNVKDGNKINKMGAQMYRIKSVPSPKIKYGNLEGGKKTKIEISVQSAINAVLEGFVFEGVKYEVQSYKYVYVQKGSGSFKDGAANGKIIDAQLKGYVSAGRASDILSIYDVKVMGPDGKPRTVAQGPNFIIQ